MLTSFAPSPMAKVISLVLYLIKSTTSALFFGVARQHITTLHEVAILKNFSLHLSDKRLSIAFIIHTNTNNSKFHLLVKQLLLNSLFLQLLTQIEAHFPLFADC